METVLSAMTDPPRDTGIGESTARFGASAGHVTRDYSAAGFEQGFSASHLGDARLSPQHSAAPSSTP